MSAIIPVLPEDVIFYGVLTRLPVKSLLRFRSVCRRWRALIGSDAFVRLHLSRAIEGKPQLFYSDGGSMYCVEGEAVVVERPLLPDPSSASSEIRSSLHGLLCVETASVEGEGGRCHHHVVNPATHEIFRLPGSSSISVSICQLLFDPSPKWGAHKVLIVSHQGSALDAKIFTLGVDRSWRSLEGAVPAAACCSSTVSLPCVNGAIHWLAEIFKIVDETADGLQPEILPTDFVAQRYGSESIVAFDIREEGFRQLAYPNCCYGGDFCGGMHDVYLFEIGGFLYFLHFDVSNATLDIWVLKDYAEEKWIREYRIDSECLRKELHLADHFLSIDVLAAFDDEIFMQVSGSFGEQVPALTSYHTVLRRFSNISENRIPDIITVDGTYVESLLSCKAIEHPEHE
ncbi:F-box protein At5g49610-like [Nymphaea colorata]|nr:F-box protein At5g49610-like [Nymphaea colorata]